MSATNGVQADSSVVRVEADHPGLQGVRTRGEANTLVLGISGTTATPTTVLPTAASVTEAGAAADSSTASLSTSAAVSEAGAATDAISLDVSVPASWQSAINLDGVAPVERQSEWQETIVRLRDFTELLRDAAPALRQLEDVRRHGIGGNNPPDDAVLSRSATDVLEEAQDASAVVITQLTSDHPDVASLRLGWRGLRRFAAWLGGAVGTIVWGTSSVGRFTRSCWTFS